MIRMRRLQNNGRTASTTGTNVETPVSVRSSPPLPFPVVSQNLPRPSESPVLPLRGEASATFVRVSDAVPVPSASGQTSRYHADSLTRDLVRVPPKKPSVVAWFQRCFRVSHLFGVPSPRKMDSKSQTHIPGISRAPTNGTSVVGNIATTARMLSLFVGSDVVLEPCDACDSCG